ncbi:MAG: AsmA-like C-terminal region-containing protein [Candidatus Krumholzibacteriota bacterium]|nr:AsmA-like C-terminal region-containing protein [Candidatus Krumholzibacteriota bacterium]
MKRINRKLLVTLVVIAIVVIAASVALRVVFTDDKLISMIVPRIEKNLGAGVEVGDVKIEFPFGFGVEVERLRVSKELESGEEIGFYSESAEVKASLMSLIRRKPKLTKVRINRGDITISKDRVKMLTVKGISSVMSLVPEDKLYKIGIALGIDSILLRSDETSEISSAAGLNYKGVIETDFPIRKTDEELFPRATINGVFKTGKLMFSGQKVPAEFEGEGSINLSGNVVATDDLVIKSGKSSSDVRFEITFDKDRKPEDLNFTQSIRIDLSDLKPFLRESSIAPEGTVALDLNGDGKLKPLIRGLKDISKTSGEGKKDQIFKDFKLEGKLDINAASIGPAVLPADISDINIDAGINRGSVRELKCNFKLNGRPFSLEGSFINIIPAALEVVSIFSGESAPDLSPAGVNSIFSGMRSDSENSIEITGSYIDLEEFLGDDSGPDSQGMEGSDSENMPRAMIIRNPVTLVFLKSLDFSARVDSVVSSRAVITSLDMACKIRNGNISLEPLKGRVAGGSFESSGMITLRNPDQIRTAMNLKADGIEIGRILSRFSSSSSLVRGKFDINSTGRMNYSRHADPLESLHARCSIYSSDGYVDFSGFFSPVTAAVPLDFSKYEKYHYETWKGDLLITGGRVIIKDWKLRSGDGDILAGGSIGLDGTLSCTAKLVIPPGAQKRMKDLSKYGDLVDLFKDDKGNLIFVFDIGGTVKSPIVKLDQTKVRDKAKKKVVDDLKKKAVEKLKGLF